MKTTITLPKGVGGFVEDKDEAKRLRIEVILPALEKREKVIIDFGNVGNSTQSFVHALVGEALQRFGAPALEIIEFKNCTPQLKSLIQLVVDYSLGGFSPQQEMTGGKPKRKK